MALDWPWLIAINVSMGIVGVILALRAIPGERTPTDAPFDRAGAVLSAGAMGALIMAGDACSHLSEGTRTFAVAFTACAYALLAAVAGLAFVWRQRHAQEPLLPLDMFSSSRFSLAAVTSLASFVGQGITFVGLPFLFQTAFGYSPLTSALLFTPWPIGIMLAAPHAGRLADRISPAMLSSAGLAVFTLGLTLLVILPSHAQVWDICWRGLVGIVMTMHAVPVESAGSTLVSAAHALEAVRVALWIAVGATTMAVAASVSRLRLAGVTLQP